MNKSYSQLGQDIFVENILKNNYKLVVDNINNQEDWWIDSNYDFELGPIKTHY
jgi:hypothetical protein